MQNIVTKIGSETPFKQILPTPLDTHSCSDFCFRYVRFVEFNLI